MVPPPCLVHLFCFPPTSADTQAVPQHTKKCWASCPTSHHITLINGNKQVFFRLHPIFPSYLYGEYKQNNKKRMPTSVSHHPPQLSSHTAPTPTTCEAALKNTPLDTADLQSEPTHLHSSTPHASQERFRLLLEVLKDVGFQPPHGTVQDLYYRRIDRDTLLEPGLVSKLIGRQEELKRVYSTAKLSCLHKNNIDKQKAPGVCLVRQLLKANGIRMVPQTESIGYEPGSGRKLVQRWYLLQPIAPR
jgi:hypothetical protein